MANSCPANIRETKIAFGFVAQPDLPTPNIEAELWSLTKTNASLSVVDRNTETDAADIGKGDEFPTTVYPVSASSGLPIEKYASSEFAAWVFAFGLGKVTVAPIGTGFNYQATPSDPVVNCINLPPFTWVEQIRTDADAIIDQALVGMVINDFTVTFESGPGRANCRISANAIGTGQVEFPSGIVIPALTPEHMLNAAGATIVTFNGIDYKLGGSFISGEFRWNNNVRTDSGYYLGSGEQDGYAIRGRMEYGTREMTLTWVARAQKGSIELNNLLNNVEAQTQISITGATIGAGPQKHSMTLTFPRTRISAVVNGDTDGIVNVACTLQILTPTDGVTPICTLSAQTEHPGITLNQATRQKELKAA